MICFKHTTKQK